MIATSDGRLVMQRRSERVFEYPGLLHVCGGALDPQPRDGAAVADPFAVMAREIEEELGVPASAIAEMDFLGLARDGLTLKPEVLLRTRLALPATELPAVSDGEHCALVLIEDEPAALAAWMRVHWAEIAPAGLACLTAHLATWGMGDGG